MSKILYKISRLSGCPTVYLSPNALNVIVVIMSSLYYIDIFLRVSRSQYYLHQDFFEQSLMWNQITAQDELVFFGPPHMNILHLDVQNIFISIKGESASSCDLIRLQYANLLNTKRTWIVLYLKTVHQGLAAKNDGSKNNESERPLKKISLNFLLHVFLPLFQNSCYACDS